MQEDQKGRRSTQENRSNQVVTDKHKKKIVLLKAMFWTFPFVWEDSGDGIEGEMISISKLIYLFFGFFFFFGGEPSQRSFFFSGFIFSLNISLIKGLSLSEKILFQNESYFSKKKSITFVLINLSHKHLLPKKKRAQKKRRMGGLMFLFVILQFLKKKKKRPLLSSKRTFCCYLF